MSRGTDGYAIAEMLASLWSYVGLIGALMIDTGITTGPARVGQLHGRDGRAPWKAWPARN